MKRNYHAASVGYIAFLLSDAMHSADYAVATCLSVRPFILYCVTRRYCVKTAEPILKLFSASGSHTILVFRTQCYGNILTVTH